MKSLYIKTYGCQMNVYDSERISEMLQPLGYTPSETMAADVVLFNACQIRKKAEEKLFSDLGRAHLLKEARKKEESDAVIVVAGCSAQALGKDIMKRAPYVDIVVGPQTYDHIPEMSANITREKDQATGENKNGLS